MILRATAENTDELRELWKICFPDEDSKYLDFYFKYIFKPENCYIKVTEGKIVSTIVRNPHAMMFNGRVIQVSMLQGVATLPEYRNRGYMHELMKIVLDACAHTELLTIVQASDSALYTQFGFENVYYRNQFSIQRSDVNRVTNFGCSFDPSPIDLLKVYSAYIKRFNGFYARDLEYFVKYKRQISMLGGKIVAYYNGKNQIQGYATMLMDGNELLIDEITYLDSVALMKLCNAALQERRFVTLQVSHAEDLQKVFPHAKKLSYPSTMARLNDPELFSKLFARQVKNVQEAFETSQKPLNLNESN